MNGRPARADDLRAFAALNYGHFTSMRVDDGGVRGLDLHLARLDSATRELFGIALDTATVRGYMLGALGGRRGAASLRVDVFARGLRRDRPAESAQVDVLTTVGPPRDVVATPVRLKSFRYERELPHIKHVGTFGQFHHRRLAQQAGFDDALFVDSNDSVSEASFWNIGFFDGRGIVWPDAPALNGISMQLMQTGLREHGVGTGFRRVTRDGLASYHAAFLTNSSCAVRPVAGIDDMDFVVDAELVARLEACCAANPLQLI